MTYKKVKLNTLSESYILLQLSLPFSPDYKYNLRHKINKKYKSRVCYYETGGIPMLSF